MLYSFRKKSSHFLSDRRVLALFLVVLLMGAVTIGRLFVLQVVRGEKYRAIAEGKHTFSEKINPERGEIFVKEYGSADLYPVAANKNTYLVYAEPSKIQNKILAAKALAESLDLDELEVKKTLSENDPYEPISHNISSETADKIKSYKIKGVGFQYEPKRVYPEDGFGGQLLGFLGYDSETNGLAGRYGLEGYFDKDLTGTPGYLEGEKDAFGSLIGLGSKKNEEAQNGKDLVLTIDRGLQFYVCSKIKNAVADYEAEMGSVIVMEPKSGKILAMCSYPDYDPNNYNKVTDQSVFNNPAIFSQYEPGSVFKAITMAAGVDAGVVSPETTYTDEGSVYIKPYTIKNSDGKTNGVQTMTQVLEKSLNTGAIYVVRELGAEKFRGYVQNFGFGSLTDIELDNEATGDISSIKKRGDIWSATASYGQGISVTSLQMLNAFNAVINGGKLMRPYLVEKQVDGSGTEKTTQSKEIRQVVSSRASTLLRGMLASVVEKGHGKRAGVAGYYVGGKTGTAQVSKAEGGGYESGKVIGSFVGFAPVDNPVFSMIVRMDNPKTVQWAESSAAPVFGEIAKYILQYYKVAPER